MLRMKLYKTMLLAGLATVTSPALAHEGESADGTTRVPTGHVRDLVADLYGGNGITLENDFHSGHFTAASTEELNNLSRVLASNVSSFSFNSSVSSISFDVESGVPVRSQESLGPLIAERASTIGKGRFNLGMSYTNITYKQLNGRDLSDYQLRLNHEAETGAPYETDYITLDLDLNLQQQIIAFYGTYGLTNDIDLGVVVPLQKIEGSVTSVATIHYVGGGPEFHSFGSLSPISTNRASATGLGDVLVRAKWDLSGKVGSGVGLGMLLQGRLPTGDEEDLLGAGSPSVYFAGILSTSMGRLSPHVNIGYEKYFDENDGIDRSNVRGLVGFDLKAKDNFSIATELMGRWEDDGDKFYDIAVGAKWAPIADIPVSANLVLPLNRNENLRPDFYFTFGIESTF